jgi:hypothetical protein
MGVWCSTRDRSTGEPGPAEARSLCWPDEKHGQFAIGELPADWVGLMQRVGKDAGRQGLGGIPTGRAEAPLPIHEHVEALARHIAWTLDTWATPVRERARLAEDLRGYQHQWQQRLRAGVAVRRDADTLTVHYSVLLALDPIPYYKYDTYEIGTGDGPDAVAELVSLHHQARSLLGVTRRREPRDLPCPSPPDGTADLERRLWGCGQYTLGWDVGADDVDCDRCGWTCDLDAYAAYAMTFVPPKTRAAA